MSEIDSAQLHRGQLLKVCAERDEAWAKANAMRPVVEGARAWRSMRADTPTKPKAESAALISAVDAWRAAQPDQTAPPADPWHAEEFAALPDVCLISGCDQGEIDERGPVWLRNGTIHKACTEHWEAIFRVLGEQAAWERTDGAHEKAPTDRPSATQADERGADDGAGAEGSQAQGGAQRAVDVSWVKFE